MKKMNLKKLLSKKMNRKQRRTLIFFLVKLGYSNLSVSDKLVKANKIVTMMTGNTNFTTPSPTLASITILIENLTAAEAALDGSKLKTEQRDIALQALEAALKDLQAYVENVASGNTEMILTSGFDVRNPRTTPTIPPAPVGLTAVSTEIEGEVKLRWTPVKGTKLYIVQYTTDVTSGNWEFAAQSTKASVIAKGLVSGQKCYFRVTAINPAGMSGYSDIADCRPN